MVPEAGSIRARSSGSWLWPLGGWWEATKSHPLVPPGHGGRLVTAQPAGEAEGYEKNPAVL